MARVFDRPKLAYVVFVVLMVGLFALGGVGQNDGSKWSWVGAIGWFGFLITALVTVLYSVLLVARMLRRRSAA
jgi:hypothetical protein